MFEPLKRQKAAKEFLMATTKIRWDRMGKPIEDIKYKRNIVEIEEESEIEKKIFLETRKFKEDELVVDLGYQTCTKMKTNRRVIFPPARNAKEEALIEVRSQMWSETFNEYVSKNCKEDGSQKTEQLSKSQERGKIKVMMRVNKKEIHVSPADKGGGIVVMPLYMYQKMVRSHTSTDQEVSWERLEEA